MRSLWNTTTCVAVLVVMLGCSGRTATNGTDEDPNNLLLDPNGNVILDDDGNPISSVDAQYDSAGNVIGDSGRRLDDDGNVVGVDGAPIPGVMGGDPGMLGVNPSTGVEGMAPAGVTTMPAPPAMAAGGSAGVGVAPGGMGPIYGGPAGYPPGYYPGGIPPYPTGSAEPEPYEVRSSTEAALAVLQETEQVEQGIATQLCECESAQYMDPVYTKECVRYRFGQSEPPPVSVCIQEILASTPLADPQALCRQEAATRMDSCLDAVGCDFERIYRCENNYWEAINACPRLPYDVDATVQRDCWGYSLPAPFLCNDGVRVHQDVVCNGNADCAGGEDESADYCPSYGYPGMVGELPPGIFYCPDGSNIIDGSAFCNGSAECADASDESADACMTAGVQVFACGDGSVVRADWVCDGVPDCATDADEQDCE